MFQMWEKRFRIPGPEKYGKAVRRLERYQPDSVIERIDNMAVSRTNPVQEPRRVECRDICSAACTDDNGWHDRI